MVVVTLSRGRHNFCWPSEDCPWVGLTGGDDLVIEHWSVCQARNRSDHKSVWKLGRTTGSGRQAGFKVSCWDVIVRWKKFQWKTCCLHAKRFFFFSFYKKSWEGRPMENLVTWCDDKHLKLSIKEKAKRAGGGLQSHVHWSCWFEKNTVCTCQHGKKTATQKCQKAMYSHMLPSWNSREPR